MKKFLTGVILVCLLCVGLVACPQHIAAETKDTGVFSGEVTLLKQENQEYVYQVNLENHGADFEGTSRVLFKTDAEDTHCAFDMPITLPANGKKQYTLTVPELNVKECRGKGYLILLDKNEKEVASITLKDLLGNQEKKGFRVGILSDHYDKLTYLDMGGEDFVVYNEGQPAILQELKADTLEDSLDGLYYLVIDQYDVSSLSKDQRKAIENWVDKGGWLIIGTGAYVNETAGAFDKSFIDMNVQGTSEKGDKTRVSAMAGQDYYSNYNDVGIDMSNMEMTDLVLNSTSGYESTENPAYLQNYGHGSVMVLYMSLCEDEMQKADAGVVSSIYNESQNIADSAYNYEDATGMYNGQLAMNIIDQMNTDVDFNWLKILIVIYVFAVGPILYLILRKAKRSEWYWIAAPLLGVVFVGSVYLIGHSMRVTEPKVYAVNVQQTGTKKEELHTYYSAYYASNKEWNFRLKDNYTYAGSAMSGYGGAVNNLKDYKTFVRYEADGLHLGLRPRESFDTGYLFAAGEGKDEGKIETENLNFSDKKQEGVIKNNTSYDFPYMAVLSRNYMYVISDVKAGETLDLKQALQEKRVVNQFTVDYMDDMYYNLVDYYGDLGEDENADCLASLYIGLLDARNQAAESETIVAGAVRNYDKTVESDCLETSYGCLYSLVKEDENAAN